LTWGEYYGKISWLFGGSEIAIVTLHFARDRTNGVHLAPFQVIAPRVTREAQGGIGVLPWGYIYKKMCSGNVLD
jgi:hypothetical protein